MNSDQTRQKARFRLIERLAGFRGRLSAVDVRSRSFLVPWLGWSVATLLVAFSLAFTETEAYQLLLLIQAFSLVKLLDATDKSLRPPVEVLLLLFVIVLLLENAFLFLYGFPAPEHAPAAISSVLQYIIIANAILLFSLILVRSNDGKKRTLLAFALFVLMAEPFLDMDNAYLRMAFYVLLFFYLLRQTRWLEELTQTECWLYLLGVYIFVHILWNWTPASSPAEPLLVGNFLWQVLPLFLFAVLKIYAIALLVKIPLVLVYNHARLSRKLWISGLFQSTVPQFIQLVLLLLIFFFLIASWQADSLLQSLKNYAVQMRMATERTSLPAETYVFTTGTPTLDVNIDGFSPFRIDLRAQNEGVIMLQRLPRLTAEAPALPSFYYFAIESDSLQRSLVLTRIDTTFLRGIAARTSLLMGTQLRAYPHYPTRWEAWLYRMDFLAEEDETRIYPFALMARTDENLVTTDLQRDRQQRFEGDVQIDLEELRKNPPIIGRILIPMYDRRMRRTGVYALDISFLPDVSFFLSPTFRYALYLMGLFFLLNSLVIRRVIKFGSEINQMIVQKFNVLKNGIREIASGNLDYKVSLEGEDEFVELAAHFNKMGEELKKSIAEAREKERLEQELEIARQVQISLLPPSLPHVENFQIAASLHTAREVGGDFYDIQPIGHEKYLFTVGDVSGKSTSAAFYMAQCISLIRYSRQFAEDPRELVVRLNTYFADPLVDRQMFITAIIGRLDAKKQQLEFVRAGHTPPILLPADPARPIHEIKTGGIGIGLERSGRTIKDSLELERMRFAPGDALVLYTDGIVEASRATAGAPENPEAGQDFFGDERLYKLLQRQRGSSAPDLLKAVEVELRAFYDGAAPVDDYTIMVIRREPEPATNQ